MAPIGLGIVGLGMAGAVMVHAAAAHGGYVLKAAADPHPGPRETFARDHNARAYADAEELMADPEVQAVYIATPHQFHAPHAVLAARHALDVAGVGVADLATFDFYSCFPVAVSVTAVDGLGLAADDPRGLTLTGGLPFFGGAGNNYSMHAIAETVQQARTAPGTFGFVGANGGMLSKYSVGVYSTTPVAWRGDDSAALQAEVDAWPAPAQAGRADGWATIETYTVTHGRAGNRTGVVVGRLADDGRRFLARTDDGDDDGDDDVLGLLSTGEPIGQRVFVRSTEGGNRVTCGAVHRA